MNEILESVLVDLTAEGAFIESLVAGLDEDGWRTMTPAEGWDVATTIAHLMWTDETSIVAIEGTLGDKTAWDALVMETIADPNRYVDNAAFELAGSLSGAELLARWQASRPALNDALRGVPAGQKIMWYGPPMAAPSMATARLMESWAHGLDIAEGLGLPNEPTDRIKHVASLGHRTRNFSYVNKGLEAPTEEFRLELKAPSGDVWTFGPEDAAQSVTGSAWDFCRLVTQRVNRADTDLIAVGADADRWLDIAQCFAGPSGTGREAQGASS